MCAIAGAQTAALPRMRGDVDFTVSVKKTIAVSKLRAGDTVQFEVLDPALVAPQVVIPDGARLRGRVMQAETANAHGRGSRVHIVVERALWRGGDVALNAYIVGQQVRRRIAVTRGEVSCDAMRRSATGADCWGQKDEVETRSELFESPTLPSDVGITLTADGETVLVSDEADIILKRGTILVLRHRPTTAN